jgi:hypothetical protein
VKNWEIIADNLSEAGWSWGCVAIGSKDEQFSLPLRIATTVSISLSTLMKKLTAFLELESAIRTFPGSGSRSPKPKCSQA